MTYYMKVDEGLELLNEFLSSTVDRLKYASKARVEYYNQTTFGNCPDRTFKKISGFIDRLIKEGKS